MTEQPPSGWLDEISYESLVRETALPGVDVLLCALRDEKPSYLLIERLDESGTRGLNLIGGRIRRDESIDDALSRHIESTLGANAQPQVLDTDHPISVSEYRSRPKVAGGPFDPRKHQVSLNYVGAITGEFVAGGEALDLIWFDLEEDPPKSVGFGQRSVVVELVNAARTSRELAALLAE